MAGTKAASFDWYIAASLGMAECSAKPSVSAIALGSISEARWALMSGSSILGRAAMPSMAPRRMITTSFRPLLSGVAALAAPAEISVTAHPARRRWRRLRARVMGLPPLEFRGHESEREALLCTLGAGDGLAGLL